MTRKSRKSRARWPPLTPEERSEQKRRNATTHGRFAAPVKLTSEAARTIVRGYHQQDAWLRSDGLDWRDYFDRPPLEELAPEWRDWAVMADWLIANRQLRSHVNQRLQRTDDGRPWSPDNIPDEPWMYGPPHTTKSKLRAALLRDPVTPLRDCLCDHRAQAACAASSRPCDWAVAARDDAPWERPAAGDD